MTSYLSNRLSGSFSKWKPGRLTLRLFIRDKDFLLPTSDKITEALLITLISGKEEKNLN